MSLKSMQQTGTEETKTVNIEIATIDLQQLKTANYKLCFSKKINYSFNVVWQAYSDYLTKNQFSWTAQYELFGAHSFINGENVNIATNIETCELGYSCTLNSAGILQPQVHNGRASCLTFRNEFGPIHDGVNQMSKGINGISVMTPVYVSENQIIKGYDELTPKEVVRVWFQQNINTGTMIDAVNRNISIQLAVSNIIDLDLSQTNTKSCLFEDGEWKIVS